MTTHKNINELGLGEQGQALARAMEAEIALLSYWVSQTLRNYKAWRHAIPANENYPNSRKSTMDRDVRNLVAKSLREYRRKRQLFHNFCLEYPFLDENDLRHYQIENHFGADVARGKLSPLL